MSNNIINTGIEEIPAAPTTPQKNSFMGKLDDKIPPMVKHLFNKFYAKKIFFWPVTIIFSLLFLIIILGLIFGRHGGQTIAIKPTPTPLPFTLGTPIPCASSDTLCQTDNQLKDLNSQINSLDLRQSRLTPPQIDYNISF